MGAVHPLDGPNHFVREPLIDARQVGLELLHGGGANQRAGHEALPVDECQRHLCRVQPVLTGKRHVIGGGALGQLSVVTRKPGPSDYASLGRPGAVEELASEHAEAKRRVREQADLLPHRHLSQPHFEAPIEQAVGILDADQAGQPEPLGKLQVAVEAPRGLVGDADVAHLARADEIAQHSQRFLDGAEIRLVGVLVAVAVGVLVGVFVGVRVGVLVAVLVGVLVGVDVGVLTGVEVAVGVGPPPLIVKFASEISKKILPTASIFILAVVVGVFGITNTSVPSLTVLADNTVGKV